MKKGNKVRRLTIKLVSYFLVLVTVGGCFPHKPGKRLAHFDSVAPPVGAPAPRFELQDLHGNVVKLEELIGENPIVLQLGSFSCPVYRNRRHGMASLYREYKDKAKFLVVYTLEAHPVGSKSPYKDREWLTVWNRIARVRVPQAADAAQRQKQAKISHAAMKTQFPMITDGMDNTIWRAYGAVSSPAFVIDRNGQIVLRQVWVNPKEIRKVLDDLL